MTAPAHPSRQRAADESDRASPGRRWPWVALAGGLLALIVWPLQVLAIAMLVTAGLMAISISAVSTEHTNVPAGVRTELNQRMPYVVVGLVAVGVVATIVWPTTLTPIAFGLLVLMCVAWLTSEWLVGRHRHSKGGRAPTR